MHGDVPFVQKTETLDAGVRFIEDYSSVPPARYALFGDRVLAHVSCQSGVWSWTLWDTAFHFAVAARRDHRLTAESAMAQAAAAFDEYHRYLASGEPDLKLIETDLVRILADGWRLPGEDS